MAPHAVTASAAAHRHTTNTTQLRSRHSHVINVIYNSETQNRPQHNHKRSSLCWHIMKPPLHTDLSPHASPPAASMHACIIHQCRHSPTSIASAAADRCTDATTRTTGTAAARLRLEGRSSSPCCCCGAPGCLGLWFLGGCWSRLPKTAAKGLSGSPSAESATAATAKAKSGGFSVGAPGADTGRDRHRNSR